MLETLNSTQIQQRRLWVFIISFFCLWTVRVFVYIHFDSNLTNDWVRAIASILFKFAFWVIPVWWYLRFVDKVDAIDFLKLNRPNRRTLKVCAAIFLLSIVWELVLRYLDLNRTNQTDVRYIATAVLATGVFEEILFRGFILNQLHRFFSWFSAFLITSLLFVLIHIPGWLLITGLTTAEILTISLSVFIMPTLLLGWLVKHTDSLYPGIFLHMINNWV